MHVSQLDLTKQKRTYVCFFLGHVLTGKVEEGSLTDAY